MPNQDEVTCELTVPENPSRAVHVRPASLLSGHLDSTLVPKRPSSSTRLAVRLAVNTVRIANVDVIETWFVKGKSESRTLPGSPRQEGTPPPGRATPSLLLEEWSCSPPRVELDSLGW
jgi:hypothetical protein